jgi:hypothetical protein
MTQPTQTAESPFFYADPGGRYTLTLLPNEDPRKVGRGGAWNYFPLRPFLSYFCWLRGGHRFVEHMREYHHDSSETAHTACLRCKMWVPF